METINQLFGIHVGSLSTCQMVVRTVFVFFTALLYIRVAGIKALGTQNAFNRLTILMMGAIMGRAIVAADQPFFPSLAAVLVIMLLHRLLAWLTFKSKKLGKIFKGEAIPLFEGGKVNQPHMDKTLTTPEDIQEAMHSVLNTEDLNKINNAYLERSGEIRITKKEE